ncbi:glycoside hydrolase family 31 protein [Geochorda subterranea]|uniref:TIM-barrel domain-containing protein n=1 Tax=Geochorda subterranea TaxID=3109564 RepID=A0ABZ1BLQ6_9FIRM|nr:TIM-barrel domain-containing protein [Limnochorda sp. LNt]WRP13619.1 TIM-barrel domain-containing protein [Limnochorda sp. LNt]
MPDDLSHAAADDAAPSTSVGPLRAVGAEMRRLVLEDRAGVRLEVSAWAPDLVRVVVAPASRPPATVGWALARPESQWDAGFPVRLEERRDGWVLVTPSLTVRVARASGAVSIEAAGHPGPIAEDVPDRPVAMDGRLRLRKRLPTGALCLGLGEKTGWLDRRGRVLEMWNTDVLPHMPDTDPLYQSIPFLVVYRQGRAWGLFLHNTHRSSFDLGATDPECLEIAVDGGVLDYFVMAGPTLEDVVHRYTELTGTMPMPPRWAVGFHQSRWGYEREQDVRALAHELRRRRIPCDAIYLDIDYMDGYRVFTWDAERFPDPSRLAADLAEQGLRIVTIVDPGVKIDPDYPVYREGLEQGLFVRKPDGRPFEGAVWPGPTVWPDFNQVAVRRWWGRWHRVLLDAGVAGIWNDMNEPASFRHPLPTGTLDLDAVHGPDEERPPEERRAMRHAEAHNVYGLLMGQATYHALLELRPGIRPFVLTRAGFAGIQRYAAVWTGDNSSWWEHLAMMGPQLLNLGLSGVAFVGADVGGFTGHVTGELLTRWTQAAAFTPFFRNHSAKNTRPQEVWRFGEEMEAICREFIVWRYRLLPYLYTLFWEAASRGTPIMRPLFWHHPGDEAAERVQDEWLLGPHLLVAPVTRPGERQRLVYLPDGEWVHLWQPVRLQGPAHAPVEAPLDQIPVFVRAGVPLPLGPEALHTGELTRDGRVSLGVAAPSSTALARGDVGGWTWLYEDDGESLAYREGDFARRRIETAWSLAGGRLSLCAELGPREGRYVPRRAWLEWVVDRVDRGRPAAVRWQGEPVEPSGEAWTPVPEQRADAAQALAGPWAKRPAWWWDASRSRLVVRVPEPTGPARLDVEWA